ncbi:hypothetical protein AKJ57_05645 [candidate division MSBL1 archaeon SCGC-AAA259A05]|uniref:PIN domain-containing protein n=1 Tax=candidate division MSBL1 archaeon SCGC-AAA259A05 TaxID=1698259 RepID=A0A133U4W3_9EURY|nr:hypothetical protein AKJ57_05645 [candidate division MSBL1 archaeon SCGC-AAA259A05]
MESTEEKFVVDTNVLISALINSDSVVWEIVEVEDLDFLVPEIVVDEIKTHKNLIKDKLSSQESKEEYEYLISEIFHSIIVVPSSVYEEKVEQAYDIMKSIDEKDTEFLALALTYDSPIWSDNGDFQEQEKVEVYTTEQIVGKLLSG